MKITPAIIKGVIAALVSAVVAAGVIDVGQASAINGIVAALVAGLAAFGIVPDRAQPTDEQA